MLGCGTSSNVGVCKEGEQEYYVISLPEGCSVDNYFNTKGEEGTISIVVCPPGELDGIVKNVKYSNVVEGGCVAYIGTCVAYIPYECGPQKIKTVCGLIANEPDDCMTIEMAKEYISFLED